MKKKKIITVLGPTAVGKTNFCVHLAKKINCDIISADSRQFYREMQIGTAQPTHDEMQGVRHHFIDSHTIQNPISAAQYEEEFLTLIKQAESEVFILTGGSGLFVKAALEGLQPIPHDEKIQTDLRIKLETVGLASMNQDLEEVDKDSSQRIDTQNSRRVLRALEVYYATGKTMTWWLENTTTTPRPFDMDIFVLERDRQTLYNRINSRVDQMIEKGLEQEVRLLESYKKIPPLQTVGYQEWWPYFNNAYDYNEVVRLMKRNTRRYAKRQLTWFKGQLNKPYQTIDMEMPLQKNIEKIIRTVF